MPLSQVGEWYVRVATITTLNKFCNGRMDGWTTGQTGSRTES